MGYANTAFPAVGPVVKVVAIIGLSPFFKVDFLPTKHQPAPLLPRPASPNKVPSLTVTAEHGCLSLGRKRVMGIPRPTRKRDDNHRPPQNS